MDKMLRWLQVLGEQLDLWGEYWEGDGWGAPEMVRRAHLLVRNAEEVLMQKEEHGKMEKREVHLRSPRVKKGAKVSRAEEEETGIEKDGEEEEEQIKQRRREQREVHLQEVDWVRFAEQGKGPGTNERQPRENEGEDTG